MSQVLANVPHLRGESVLLRTWTAQGTLGQGSHRSLWRGPLHWSSKRQGQGTVALAPSRPVLTRLFIRPLTVLHNLLPCPMLYRLADRHGHVWAQGVLPVGLSLPLCPPCPRSKLFLSVRLANYLWSSFARVHSPVSSKDCYPVNEKTLSLELKGLSHQQLHKAPPPLGRRLRVGFDAPSQVLQVSLRGRHVRVWSKVVLLNRSELLLHYKDGSLTADVSTAASPPFLPHPPLRSSQPPNNTTTPDKPALPLPSPSATATASGPPLIKAGSNSALPYTPPPPVRDTPPKTTLAPPPQASSCSPVSRVCMCPLSGSECECGGGGPSAL